MSRPRPPLEYWETASVFAVCEEEKPEPEKIRPAYELIPMGEFTLVFYCPCVQCTGIWSAEHPNNVDNPYFVQRTASGTIPTAGRTIATDTRIIPFGTQVVINGQIFVAEDIGSAIDGNILDVFVYCHFEALQLGRQRAEIYVKVWNDEP
jgi:3D (Asp-Asp-Asp) domain-containing protein